MEKMRKGINYTKHLEVKLQGQKHTSKALLSSLDCEHVIHQQLCGTCSAKLLKIKKLRKPLCFSISVKKISLSKISDLSSFIKKYQLNYFTLKASKKESTFLLSVSTSKDVNINGSIKLIGLLLPRSF